MQSLDREELNQRLQLKTTQSRLLGIEQLRILCDTLDTNSAALDAFAVLMLERHERARINSRQALEISHRDGRISKLQQTILNLENSEIFKLGKLIWSSLHHKKGKEQKTELLEYNLVPKDEYNQTVADLQDIIKELQLQMKQQTVDAKAKIGYFEERIDSLLEQLKLIQDYTIARHGSNSWVEITTYLQKEIKKGA